MNGRWFDILLPDVQEHISMIIHDKIILMWHKCTLLCSKYNVRHSWSVYVLVLLADLAKGHLHFYVHLGCFVLRHLHFTDTAMTTNSFKTASPIWTETWSEASIGWLYRVSIDHTCLTTSMATTGISCFLISQIL